MEKGNWKIKKKLIRVFGNECMFKKYILDNEGDESIKEIIDGYNAYKKQTKYSDEEIAQLEEKLTYHHIKHKSNGGEETLSNGVVLGELAHRYLHTLSKEEEAYVNDIFRIEKERQLEKKYNFLNCDFVEENIIEEDFPDEFDILGTIIYGSQFKKGFIQEGSDCKSEVVIFPARCGIKKKEYLAKLEEIENKAYEKVVKEKYPCI